MTGTVLRTFLFPDASEMLISTGIKGASISTARLRKVVPGCGI
jgi:hypothetical protein